MCSFFIMASRLPTVFALILAEFALGRNDALQVIDTFLRAAHWELHRLKVAA